MASMQDYIECVRHLIESPKNVFDIGSRDGDDANMLGNAFNIAHENIYTFECNTTNYESIISKYPKMNNFSFGVSNKNGEETFYNVTNSSNIGVSSFLKENKEIQKNSRQFIETTVNTKRMDDFLTENNINNLDIVKIDVEGFSYECLEGFGEKIQNIKIIHIENEHKECWENQKLYDDVHNMLVKQNFSRVLFKYGNEKKEQSDSIYVNNEFVSKEKIRDYISSLCRRS